MIPPTNRMNTVTAMSISISVKPRSVSEARTGMFQKGNWDFMCRGRQVSMEFVINCEPLNCQMQSHGFVSMAAGRNLDDRGLNGGLREGCSIAGHIQRDDPGGKNMWRSPGPRVAN